MRRRWATVSDELSRTIFKGQYDLVTGEPAAETIVLPRVPVCPDSSDKLLGSVEHAQDPLPGL